MSKKIREIVSNMGNELFKEYIFDFFGVEGLFNYWDNTIKSTSDNDLKKWTKELKEFIDKEEKRCDLCRDIVDKDNLIPLTENMPKEVCICENCFDGVLFVNQEIKEGYTG